jgi:hypothetical protein
LPPGNYHIRAYTRWMMNSGAESFFDQTVAIGSLRPSKIPEAMGRPATAVNKPDIQFFPEGGKLVNGIKSKIAFKAIDANGSGIAVKGELVDNNNQPVLTFASEHLGMGSFYFTPVEGETYKAKITYPNGLEDNVELPTAEAQGIVLSVNDNLKTSESVTIATTKSFFNQNKSKNYSLVIYSGGFATSIICRLDSEAVSLDVLKQNLKTGVASFVVFSPSGEPLCERLVFVQNNDNLNVNVTGDKDIYKTREKVNLKFNVKNNSGGTIGHFSVSVISENACPVNENAENTILTNLLLTSDLKGFIEQPNYYFTNVTDKTNADLDLVMLTHGYRKFEWKQVLNDQNKPPLFTAETNLEISGIVKSNRGQPLPNTPVGLLSMNGGPVLIRETDAIGVFHFSNLAFGDSAHFFLRVTGEKMKNNTQLFYTAHQPAAVTDSVFRNSYQNDLNKLMTVYLENKKIQQEDIAQYGPLNGTLLREIKIRNTMKEEYRTSSLAGAGHADQVIKRSEIRGNGCFSDVFEGRLLGITFVGKVPCEKLPYLTVPFSINFNGTMLVVVDGIQFPDSTFSPDEININDIQTVEVLRHATSAGIYGSYGAAGVLIITTRRGGDEVFGEQLAPGMLAVAPRGYYKARQFYAPKYDHQENGFVRKDLRSTIFWKPELVTDKDGNASIDYYNADATGSYRVVIEGIDENGNLGRQVYRYKVE